MGYIIEILFSRCYKKSELLETRTQTSSIVVPRNQGETIYGTQKI